jgi:uncharacterized protein YkwD
MMRPLSIGVAGVLMMTGASLGLAAHARSTTPIAPTLQAAPTSMMRAQPIAPRIAQAAPNTATLEQAVFKQINDYRASQKLAPLVLDSRISTQARQHSQNMANKTVPFGHQGFQQRVQVIGQAIPFSSAAENVAFNMGFKDPATQAVQGWLKSPGHLQNIRGAFNLTGIGVSQNAKGEVYFTQIFIKKR